MYEWFTDELTGFSWRVRQALSGDVDRQLGVLTGAATVLEDNWIRSGSSEDEFKRLARGYQNELWPNEFKEQSLGAKASAVVATASKLVAEINGITGGK
jgi:hypothetical protein